MRGRITSTKRLTQFLHLAKLTMQSNIALSQHLEIYLCNMTSTGLGKMDAQDQSTHSTEQSIGKIQRFYQTSRKYETFKSSAGNRQLSWLNAMPEIDEWENTCHVKCTKSCICK